MSKIVNLTPHAITLIDGATTYTFPPSGIVPRMASSTKEVEGFGFPVVMTTFGEVEGLPPAEEGTAFIVSTMLAKEAKRPDLLAPDTGPTAIRQDGQVVAVLGFQVFA